MIFEWVSKGYTPLFEWMSPSHQIILEYPADSLTLISVRDNHTGEYLNYEEMRDYAEKAGIPVTPKYSHLEYGVHYKTTDELVECIKSIDGIEGIVIMFEKGEMYKLKSNWYVAKSKRSNEQLSLFEKDLWVLVLDGKVDDLSDLLGERRKNLLDEFGLNLMSTLQKNADKMTAKVNECKAQGMDKRTFVAKITEEAKNNNSDTLLKNHFPLYFKVYDGADAFDVVREFVRSNVNTLPKIEKMRNSLCGGNKIQL